ncbi:MAG: DUF805 domain-containing protein [Bacteroidales bacterium]|nr:DUF805 domain-containing protein [Bacteroidales bacterium]
MKWFFKCLKQYADFSGRARRKEYWWFTVINFIIMMALMIGFCIPFIKIGYNSAVAGVDDFDEMEIMLTAMKSPFLYIYLIYYLAIIIPSLAVMVRRLHDIGKSGFWAFFICGGSLLGTISSYIQGTNTVVYILIALAGFVICIISLVWMFTNSDYGPNQYGPNPKGEGNPTEEQTTLTE